MTTRTEYINAVKAKLDEISPFEEPDHFIAATSVTGDTLDEDYTKVKPVISYIESELDNAAQFCLNALPISLLADDVDEDTMTVCIDANGVGHIKDFYEYLRLLRVACVQFDRDVTAFITSVSPIYLLQQNKYTRGGQAKPVVSYTPEKAELELFSFPAALNNQHSMANVRYIDCRKKVEMVHSHIERFIVIRAAMNVMRILGDDNAVARLTNEFNEAVAPIQS